MSGRDRSTVIAVLYPEDGEFRPVEERRRDVAALAGVGRRIVVREPHYPPSARPADADRAGASQVSKDDMGRVNAVLTPAIHEALADAEVVLAHDLPPRITEVAPRLRWIQGIGAGVRQLATPEVVARQIRITSAAGANAASVAEFAVLRLLMHVKDAHRLDDCQSRRLWGPAPTAELAGSRVGIVGFGTIGRAVAARLASFDVEVWVARRTPQGDEPALGVSRTVGLDRLGELLGRCDAVVAALPDTVGTRGIFGAAAFASMRPGAFFCNVGRGSAVVEPDLLAALQSGTLGGAALDVASVEPLPPDNPLWDAPRLMLSPHVAASLDHFFARVHRIFRDNLEAYLDGRPLHNEWLDDDAPRE